MLRIVNGSLDTRSGLRDNERSTYEQGRYAMRWVSRSRFFVIVFAVDGALCTDYGWAATPEQFYKDIRYRVMHPARYKKYALLSRASFTDHEIRDITKFRNHRKNKRSAAAIKRIVERLELSVGSRPIT